MNKKLISMLGIIGFVFIIAIGAHAEEKKEPPKVIGGPFGAKPIQLAIDSKGIHKHEGGYTCELVSAVSKVKYSEWGQTEEDAKTIVYKKCCDKSGMLLCKIENAKCEKDK